MRQEQFVARHQHEWQQFERWLQVRGNSSRRARGTVDADTVGDETIPGRYRRLCQHLALARGRGYSPQLTAYLQELMQRGHNLLYRAPPPRWRRAVEFLIAGFPRQVRQQSGCMWAALLLFAVPLLGIYVLVQFRPDLVHLLLTPAQTADIERMYDPAAHKLGRDSGSDWRMFGHYIMHNTSIAMRTFASGLLAGLGTILVLLHNGLFMGAVMGHLTQAGLGGQLWRFVVGHGAFELTGIVIAGGAGLQLGLKLLAPGRRRRADALREGGIIGARLCLGVAFMMLVAAFIEAFWSSSSTLPAWIMYSVAAVLWLLVLAWLLFGGRGGGSDDAN